MRRIGHVAGPRTPAKHPVEKFIVFAVTTIGFGWWAGADVRNDGDQGSLKSGLTSQNHFVGTSGVAHGWRKGQQS